MSNERSQEANNYGEEQQIIHGGEGGNKPTSQVPVAGAKKAAPLPEGLLEEVNDSSYSGGAAPGHSSGKGHVDGPRKDAEDQGEGKFGGDNSELDALQAEKEAAAEERQRKRSERKEDDEEEGAAEGMEGHAKPQEGEL